MLWISRGIPCSSELWEQIYGGKGRLKLSETKHPFRNSSGWRPWTHRYPPNSVQSWKLFAANREKEILILSLGSPVLFLKKAKLL